MRQEPGAGGLSRWDSTAPIRYPDPDIRVLDPRFQPLVLGHAAIERIATGFRFTEGPAYYGDGRYLLFSDIPNDALLRWDEITGAVATLRQPAGYPDGNTRDRQGRLLSCELGSRKLTRTEHDGTVTVLAEAFEGTRLTGPNDVVVKSDGSIWFSDNGAGIRGNYLGDKAPQEMPFRVYRLDPASGTLRIAADDMERPNGLCFCPTNRGSMWSTRRAARGPRGSTTWWTACRSTAGCSSMQRPAGPTASAATPRVMSGAASPAERARMALPSSPPTAR